MNVKRNGTKKFTNALHFVLDCEIILNNTFTDLLWKIIQDPNENFIVLKSLCLHTRRHRSTSSQTSRTFMMNIQPLNSLMKLI